MWHLACVQGVAVCQIWGGGGQAPGHGGSDDGGKEEGGAWGEKGLSCSRTMLGLFGIIKTDGRVVVVGQGLCVGKRGSGRGHIFLGA